MSRSPELPHDDKAEQSLLGACLLSDIAIERASAIVTPEDFLKPLHQALFFAIIAAWGEGPVDALIVNHRVPEASLEYLLELQNAMPSISNAGKYATIVAGEALRRRLIVAAAEISMLGWGEIPSSDAGEAADRARELLAGLDMPQQIGPPDRDVDTFLDAIDIRHDWLVEDFLERRDRMLVTAGEGAGKSVWLRQLAVQVAAGVHPWTQQPCPPRNVLIVDCENSERQMSRSLSQLRAKVGGVLNPQRLRIHSRPAGLDLTTRADKRWLQERVQSNGCELLVIGPAYRLSAGVAARGDIGGEDHARTVTAALDEIRVRFNVALIIETHAPHANAAGRDLRPFGSSVWLRWPEFGLGLRREPEDENKFKLEHWRGARDWRPWPDALHKGGAWPWSPYYKNGYPQ